MIPKKKFQEGFVRCSYHVQSLIESSQILFNEGKYSSSLSLSIIALEETTKLHLLNNHFRNNKNISTEEWKSVTGPGAHRAKLSRIIRDSQRVLKKYDSVLNREILYRSAGVEDKLTKFTKVKQDCLYLNWKYLDWFSYSNFNEIQKKALAYVNLITAKFLFYHQIRRRYLEIVVDELILQGKKTTADLTVVDQERLENTPYEDLIFEINHEMQTPLFRGSTMTSRYLLGRYYS